MITARKLKHTPGMRYFSTPFLSTMYLLVIRDRHVKREEGPEDGRQSNLQRNRIREASTAHATEDEDLEEHIGESSEEGGSDLFKDALPGRVEKILQVGNHRFAAGRHEGSAENETDGKRPDESPEHEVEMEDARRGARAKDRIVERCPAQNSDQRHGQSDYFIRCFEHRNDRVEIQIVCGQFQQTGQSNDFKSSLSMSDRSSSESREESFVVAAAVVCVSTNGSSLKLFCSGSLS